MKIHQILINDTNKLPNEFPEFHNSCHEQIKKLYADEEYHLYSGEELEEIIKSNFDDDVFISYKKLRPYAFKSDLARLCLLYLYGGLYTDLNFYFINKIPNLNELEFFAFRSIDVNKNTNKNFRLSNGLIYSIKNQKIIENAIKLIIQNCKNEYYGINCLDVSGPTLLGTSVKQIKNEYYDITCGEFCFFDFNLFKSEIKYKLNQIGYVENIQIGYVMDTNELISIRRPLINGNLKQGDISSIGFGETNNYAEMWRNKNVYDEKYKFKNTKLISMKYQ